MRNAPAHVLIASQPTKSTPRPSLPRRVSLTILLACIGLATWLPAPAWAAKLATTTALSLSTSTLAFEHEQTEIFTVAVTANSGSPTGKITVKAGTKTVCKTTLTNGAGMCSPNAKTLAIGDYSITARYGGSTHFAKSISSAESLTIVKGTSPGAPTNVSATANGDKSAVVSWTAPADNGLTITEYSVMPQPACPACTGLSVTGMPPTTSTTIAGLSDGTSYRFIVRASNAAGIGPESAPSEPPVTPGVPTAPTITSLTPADHGIVVHYTAALTQGASPIVGYTAECGSRTTKVGGTTLEATITGLNPGTRYKCDVFATNEAGFAGPDSASVEGGAGGWSSVSVPSGGVLAAVACPTSNDCWAVGANGTILTSSDGGKQWEQQSSHTSANLLGIYCLDSSECIAVGSEVADVTTNGSSWSPKTASIPANLDAIACVTSSECWAAGLEYMYESRNFGTTWKQTEHMVTPGQLTGVACPSDSNCWASVNNGNLAQYTGGLWGVPAIDAKPAVLYGITCPSTNDCFAGGTGNDGSSGIPYIYFTTDASESGAAWSVTAPPSVVSRTITGVSCANTAHCWASSRLTGATGEELMYGTTNGSSWEAHSLGGTTPLYAVAAASQQTAIAVGGSSGAAIYRGEEGE
jgi:Bacterial Ig-like domain (group 3)/Fibronectin type III domain